jgi:hypothetical protein
MLFGILFRSPKVWRFSVWKSEAQPKPLAYYNADHPRVLKRCHSHPADPPGSFLQQLLQERLLFIFCSLISSSRINAELSLAVEANEGALRFVVSYGE